MTIAGSSTAKTGTRQSETVWIEVRPCSKCNGTGVHREVSTHTLRIGRMANRIFRPARNASYQLRLPLLLCPKRNLFQERPIMNNTDTRATIEQLVGALEDARQSTLGPPAVLRWYDAALTAGRAALETQGEADSSVTIHIDQYDKLECCRRLLEIIATGDSEDPRKDAEDELVAHGFWNPTRPQASEPAWRPIESAPKYKEVLVYRDDSGPFIAKLTTPDEVLSDDELAEMDFPDDFEEWFSDAYGWQEKDQKPTHWMPLPAAPEAKQ